MRRRPLVSTVFTQLNIHAAVVALLLLFNLVLLTRLVVAWHDSHSDRSAQFAADTLAYDQLQSQAAMLRTLPARMSASRTEANAFIASRIPTDYSEVLTELGELTTRDHVRLIGAHYAPRPGIPGLVELRIDANISAEYPAIMHFINDVERDKNHAFYIIRTIVLSGQQNGLVSLRLVMTTYLHPDAANAQLLEAGSRAAENGSGGNTE